MDLICYWHRMKNRIIRGNADELETILDYLMCRKLEIGSNEHQANLKRIFGN